jgi:hypothetical protein
MNTFIQMPNTTLSMGRPTQYANAYGVMNINQAKPVKQGDIGQVSTGLTENKNFHSNHRRRCIRV